MKTWICWYENDKETRIIVEALSRGKAKFIYSKKANIEDFCKIHCVLYK